MRMLWKYLAPQRGLIALSLLLAGIAQILALVDPIIFGWIIDRYATNRDGRSPDELVTGALGLLALAVVVAIASRFAKAVREYLTRLVVQRFGTRIFNAGLRQTLSRRPHGAAEPRDQGAAALHRARDRPQCRLRHRVAGATSS